MELFFIVYFWSLQSNPTTLVSDDIYHIGSAFFKVGWDVLKAQYTACSKWEEGYSLKVEHLPAVFEAWTLFPNPSVLI